MRPGRMHDVTAACNEGIDTCFQQYPDVEVLLNDGYLGLRTRWTHRRDGPPDTCRAIVVLVSDRIANR